MRLLNALLTSGQLAHNHVEYYMAYTAYIFDMLDSCDWESILEFDCQYRELQAEFHFQWGTHAPQLESRLLVPRRKTDNKLGKYPHKHPDNKNAHVSTYVPECKQFLARGWCRFGDKCKYTHVTPPKNDQNSLQRAQAP